jgi:hypothetical protein
MTQGVEVLVWTDPHATVATATGWRMEADVANR